MVGARFGLALLAQALLAAAFLLCGHPNPWLAAAPWWTVYGSLIDLACVALLSYLVRGEGLRLIDLLRLQRLRLNHDLSMGLALTLLDLIVGAVAGGITTLVLYGGSQPEVALMGGLPVWAVAYSLLVWPVLWGITEELTYQGYALPRLEARTGQPWPAILIVTGGFGLQHIALPLVPNGTFMLWRLLPSLVLGLINAALYLRLRRLVPFVIAHWAANVVSVLTLAVLPLLGG